MVPLVKDLNNFLVGLKKKVCGKSTMHLGELAEWCLNNSKVPADTEEMQDEPFVVKYLFNGLVKARELLGLEPLSKISLMAENAESITNGLENSELDKNVRGNCWFHVKNNNINITKL